MVKVDLGLDFKVTECPDVFVRMSVTVFNLLFPHKSGMIRQDHYAVMRVEAKMPTRANDLRNELKKKGTLVHIKVCKRCLLFVLNQNHMLRRWNFLKVQEMFALLCYLNWIIQPCCVWSLTDQVSELLEELQDVHQLLLHQRQSNPLCLQHLQLHLKQLGLLWLLLQLLHHRVLNLKDKRHTRNTVSSLVKVHLWSHNHGKKNQRKPTSRKIVKSNLLKFTVFVLSYWLNHTKPHHNIYRLWLFLHWLTEWNKHFMYRSWDN